MQIFGIGSIYPPIAFPLRVIPAVHRRGFTPAAPAGVEMGHGVKRHVGAGLAVPAHCAGSSPTVRRTRARMAAVAVASSRDAIRSAQLHQYDEPCTYTTSASRPTCGLRTSRYGSCPVVRTFA